MNYESAREEIKDRWEEILSKVTSPAKKRVNGHTSYICPFCGHGTHGDGLTFNPNAKDPRTLKCFNGACGFSGDIIDLIGKLENIPNYTDQLKRAGEYIGITIDNYREENQNQPKNEQHTDMDIHTYTYTQKSKTASNNITTEAPKDFRLSCLMDSKQYTQKPSAVWEIRQREKVPTPAPEEFSLEEFARAVTSGRTFYPSIYSKEQVGVQGDGKPIYKYRPISQQVFVVDIDNEETYKNEAGKFQKRRIKNPLTIDKAKEICTKYGVMPFFIYETFSSKKHRDDTEAPYTKFRLCFATNKPITIQEHGEKGLDTAINYFINLFGEGADTGTKDYARLIYGTDEKERAYLYRRVIDADKLMQRLYEAPEPEAEQEADLEAEKEKYLESTAYSHLQEFINGIAESANTPAQPTGFSNLDTILDGGLYEGLYIIGAITSLGKTTFALQIADQIAESGRDVLIFSLEMARAELMSKSISRQTLLDVLRNGGEVRNAKTNRGITAGARYKNYSQEERELIARAIKAYSQYASHIYIQEGIGDIGVKQIREKIQMHIALTGQAPVVLIDYLQILAPYDVRATDKQNTDKAVLELKRISRDFKIPVIGISSFNRDNYIAPVNLTSFKESGAIEYSSDVLIGLQYEGMDYIEGEADKAREKRIRTLLNQVIADGNSGNAQRIQVKVLKQRNGGKGEAILKFYPLFNYFTEN